ncbi:MAG: glycoside hydrolase family 25 [Lactobacillus sp.]|nr:glycoside hydrolase family 25 [Lactobacillus sp.]
MLKMVDVYSGSPRSFATQTGTDITMVKATQGTGYVNPYCDIDYQAAKKAGKLLGIYHYCGGGSATAEAKYFYKNIKGYIGEAVPAVDWESYQNSSWGDKTYVRAFVDEFHKLSGVWPLIYVQQSALAQVANCAKDCGLWVAWYASMDWKSWTLPNAGFSVNPWATYTAWQFTGGDMDRSVVNTTKEGWKKLAKGSAVKKSNGWIKKKGTFTLGEDLQLHESPHVDSPAIAKLKKGDVIKFDATLQGSLRLWLRQPRKGGKYGYIVAVDRYGKKLGKIK